LEKGNISAVGIINMLGPPILEKFGYFKENRRVFVLIVVLGSFFDFSLILFMNFNVFFRLFIAEQLKIFRLRREVTAGAIG